MRILKRCFPTARHLAGIRIDRKVTTVRRSLLVISTILALCILGQAAPQSGMSAQPAAPASTDGRVGPSAIWQPPQDFLAKAHAVCDKGAGPASFPECFINQIAAAGAPADAVSFTRMLYQQSNGQVGIMSAFQKVGPVDEAQVFFPLRANDNYGLLLVNGDPRILDVDNMEKLDSAAMDEDPMYVAVKKKFPEAALWPGDRSGTSPWPQVKALEGGGTEFLVRYPIINGCHACRLLGTVRFGWDFDASGKFLKARYLPIPPLPKILHERKTPPAPDQTAPAPQTPPAASTPPQQNP
jgi:hypothetical protein